MTTEKKAKPVKVGRGTCGSDNSNRKFLDSQVPRNIKYQRASEHHQRAYRRLVADAYMMSKRWPALMRFSYYVDRNGILRCMTKRGSGS